MLSRLVRPSASILGQLNALQQSQMAIVRFVATSSPVTSSGVPAAKTGRAKRMTLEEVLTADPVSKMPEGPERDVVNFPRIKRAIDTPKASLGFIPESYFRLFYPRLGVTGGWTFGIGFTAYILSKEIWVMEHEFWNGVSLAIIFTYVIKKFGPALSAYLEKEQQLECDQFNEGKYSQVDSLTSSIDEEKTAQLQAVGCQEHLFEAKRQNVALQLEATYRERVATVYAEVKKRLDYQVEKQNVERNVEQKHMVNWIISKVQKSITADSETENIKKCIADLKLMASRAATA